MEYNRPADSEFELLRLLKERALANQLALAKSISEFEKVLERLNSHGDFPDYETLRVLKQIALKNQNDIGTAITSLQRASSLLKSQSATVPAAVGERIESMTDRIAMKVVDALTGSLKHVAGEAERARNAYHSAAEEARRRTTRSMLSLSIPFCIGVVFGCLLAIMFVKVLL